MKKENELLAGGIIERQFAYSEDLLIAQDVIENHYKECECIAYRTFITNPPTEKDITPQIYRVHSKVNLELSEEDYQNLTEEERKKYVSERAISVHKTEDKGIKEARRAYKQRKKKAGEDAAELYIHEERGTLIGRVIITPEVGVFSGFNRGGHGNLLLKGGVEPKDIIDPEYEIKPYKYKDDEDVG